VRSRYAEQAAAECAGLLLDTIAMGNIDGDLTIHNNQGFTDVDATAFAEARTVGGSIGISFNRE
jgi:hypothetical protein